MNSLKAERFKQKVTLLSYFLMRMRIQMQWSFYCIITRGVFGGSTFVSPIIFGGFGGQEESNPGPLPDALVIYREVMKLSKQDDMILC